MYTFLVLHPSGRFLMAAEWADRELSRAAGRWSTRGDQLALDGAAHVETNQGQWEVPFHRAFRVHRAGERGSASRVRLVPIPEINHYGMLGWPNAYLFQSPQSASGLPHWPVPSDTDGLIALIDRLIAEARQPPTR